MDTHGSPQTCMLHEAYKKHYQLHPAFVQEQEPCPMHASLNGSTLYDRGDRSEDRMGEVLRAAWRGGVDGVREEEEEEGAAGP